jgi:hypothetical protein
VRFSTHYFVLSLSPTRNALLEAFRDLLIDVENEGFPIAAPAGKSRDAGSKQRSELMRTVDAHFDRYYAREPLRLVVVGSPEMQRAFDSVTDHGPAVVGRVIGDQTATSPRDLGKIVWSVVREAMSGVLDRSMRDLADCSERGRVVVGLEAVVRAASRAVRATLLVEEDYHLRGTVRTEGGTVLTSADIDVRDTIDDAVDGAIEKVLESEGNVVFTPPGALRDQERIVLLLPSRSPFVSAGIKEDSSADGGTPS